jgi:hypothetical protein
MSSLKGDYLMSTIAMSLGLSRARLSLVAVLSFLGLALVALASSVPSVGANEGFSNRSLRGEWGFSAGTTLYPPAVPVQTPAAVVGLMSFDGHGGCAVSETFNFGGFSGSQSSTSCSYTVNPDGTGTMSVQTPSGPVAVSFVLVANKKEFLYIRTDQVVANGVAKQQ